QLLSLRRQMSHVDVQRRIPDGDDPGLGDRVGVPARERVADGFLEDRLAADPLDHERRWDLALAKAWELQLPAELAGPALDAILDLRGLDLDLQSHPRVAQLGNCRLQGPGHGRHDTVRP